MRIDKFLKVSRIIKRRTVANEACDAGRVSLNGKVVKAGADVKVGAVGIYFRRGKAEVSRLLAAGALALYFCLLDKALNEMRLCRQCVDFRHAEIL